MSGSGRTVYPAGAQFAELFLELVEADIGAGILRFAETVVHEHHRRLGREYRRRPDTEGDGGRGGQQAGQGQREREGSDT